MINSHILLDVVYEMKPKNQGGRGEKLEVLHSYIHASGSKVTSLTISIPFSRDKFCIITFSDKKNIIRLKLSMDEVAGLADSVGKDVEWRCYHTFKKGEIKTETRMQYNNNFINAEKERVKIALKLTPDERSSFRLLLEGIFHKLV
jgi:hypothetical protein